MMVVLGLGMYWMLGGCDGLVVVCVCLSVDEKYVVGCVWCFV